MSGITLLCFAASYVVVLLLEITGLWFRFGWHRLIMVFMALAGLMAHTLYLALRVTEEVSVLGSPNNWYVVVAWVLAGLYLITLFTAPGSSMGLFILPLVLSLLGFAHWATEEPFMLERASLVWNNLHGGLMLLATVSVCIGFLAGLMYLMQSWRLKHKVPKSSGIQLPSLEWLERVNSRALGISALLVAGGFFSGIVLSRIRHSGEDGYRLLTDPVVLSLAVMLLWLVVAEVFRLVYPAARRGRKVAYQTLAAFGFLVITLLSLAMTGTHGRPPTEEGSASHTARPAMATSAKLPACPAIVQVGTAGEGVA